MNLCKDCIWKTTKIGPTECPQCKCMTLLGELDGPTMISTCSNCGFEIVSASFFPPCHLDIFMNPGYAITINNVDKGMYVQIAKLFDINVVKLKHLVDAGSIIRRDGLTLDEAVDIAKKLHNANVVYEIIPDRFEKYPEILDCKLR